MNKIALHLLAKGPSASLNGPEARLAKTPANIPVPDYANNGSGSVSPSSNSSSVSPIEKERWWRWVLLQPQFHDDKDLEKGLKSRNSKAEGKGSTEDNIKPNENPSLPSERIEEDEEGRNSTRNDAMSGKEEEEDNSMIVEIGNRFKYKDLLVYD